ncbi:MAG TPA: VOC family protein [Flavisolibacter sp.]|nr:VOC family protein [Flavisolibacter sp.]
MEQRLTLITLGVADVQTAANFYENKFGWTKAKTSNADIVFFQLNGIQLALYAKEKLAEDANSSAVGSGFKAFTLSFNTRTINEVDELMTILKQRGVTIVKAAEKAVWGGYSGYVSDPDGNLWEIAYNPFLPLDAKGNIVNQ